MSQSLMLLFVQGASGAVLGMSSVQTPEGAHHLGLLGKQHACLSASEHVCAAGGQGDGLLVRCQAA